MRPFRVGCRVENAAHRKKGATVGNVLVDTGSEYTWLPSEILERVAIAPEKKDLAFVMANGQ
jgi:predicted aspartyl protease